MSGDGSNPANLGHALETAHSTAQEEFYRYMLMKEKLAGTGNEDILQKRSELDQIQMSILRKVFLVNESSAEFDQLVSITGSRDRFKQAEYLAKIQHDKLLADRLLQTYGSTKAEIDDIFTNSDTAAMSLRTGTASLAVRRSTAGGVAAAAASALGLSAPGSATAV